MKKAVIIIVILLGLALAGLVGWMSSGRAGNEPRFERARTPPRFGTYTALYYEFLAHSPFEGGKMWITTIAGTNTAKCYLYDIERRAVQGELLNAAPVFLDGNQSKLLCIQHPKNEVSLRGWLLALVRRITHPKAPKRSPSARNDVFWMLDLNSNSRSRIGEASRVQSTIQPSPTFRYGFVKPMDNPDRGRVLLFDLEQEHITLLNLPGRPQGWWDERNIIMKDPTNNFALYDVASGKQSPLWNAAQLADFFTSKQLSDDPAKANCFSIWNGKQNDIFLAELHKKWEAVESYLVKVERPDRTLRLVAPNFKFEWSDHFDGTGRWYVYSGRKSGDASSAVFVRDMQDNTVRTLVPSDGGKYFSIPRIYRDEVIYTRSNLIWHVGLDGSNPSRLFPPPEGKASAP